MAIDFQEGNCNLLENNAKEHTKQISMEKIFYCSPTNEGERDDYVMMKFPFFSSSGYALIFEKIIPNFTQEAKRKRVHCKSASSTFNANIKGRLECSNMMKLTKNIYWYRISRMLNMISIQSIFHF